MDFVLEGWPDIYGRQTEIRDFSTEWCAHAYGNTATTLECRLSQGSAGGRTGLPGDRKTALSAFGMVDLPLPAARAKKHIRMENYVLKSKEGRLCRSYKHLDPVCKGERIALYDDGEALML